MRRVPLFILLTLLTAFSLLLLIYPLAILMPFVSQTPEQLQRALLVFRIAPLVSLVLAMCAAIAVLLAWKRLRSGARFASVALAVIVFAVAALSRVNVYEQMFHPAGAPRFLSMSEAKIQPADMLIAAGINGESHAYPIREMAYHHVVNDFVGGVPIVATY